MFYQKYYFRRHFLFGIACLIFLSGCNNQNPKKAKPAPTAAATSHPKLSPERLTKEDLYQVNSQLMGQDALRGPEPDLCLIRINTLIQSFRRDARFEENYFSDVNPDILKKDPYAFRYRELSALIKRLTMKSEFAIRDKKYGESLYSLMKAVELCLFVLELRPASLNDDIVDIVRYPNLILVTIPISLFRADLNRDFKGDYDVQLNAALAMKIGLDDRLKRMNEVAEASAKKNVNLYERLSLALEKFEKTEKNHEAAIRLKRQI